MKLLFDHNLSPRLVLILADLYPNSQHVFPLQMDRDDDRLIWDYALQNEYIIVTRDSDYNDLSLIRGFPPKVIWIRRGNCSTKEIEVILRSSTQDIHDFFQNPSLGILTLSQGKRIDYNTDEIASNRA
jgi:predicted nuclease of predicted toxin-antitoxin system